jgi:hypothetical protein
MYTRVIIFKDINNFKIFLDSADGDIQLLGKTSCFSNLKYQILIDKERSFDKFYKEKQIEITEAVKRCIVNYKMKQ